MFVEYTLLAVAPTVRHLESTALKHAGRAGGGAYSGTRVRKTNDQEDRLRLFWPLRNGPRAGLSVKTPTNSPA